MTMLVQKLMTNVQRKELKTFLECVTVQLSFVTKDMVYYKESVQGRRNLFVK